MEAKLTIASYNIHGSGENVLKLLDEVELDIIAINEAYKESTNMIAEDLELDSRFGVCNNNFGNGILSEHEIVESENFILTSRSESEHPRSLLRAKILLYDQPPNKITITLFVTHLEHKNEQTRLNQLNEILEIISAWETAHPEDAVNGHLLLGDLNAVSRADYSDTQWDNIINYRIEKGWTDEGIPPPELVIPRLHELNYSDLFTLVGSGESFTVWTKKPMMRIDYIFASKNFMENNKNIKAVKCYRENFICSDHFPVVAEFVVKL